MLRKISLILLSSCLWMSSAHSAPKKLLVVTITKGFRHSSISTAEKVLGELAEKSDGQITVDYARVDPNASQFKGANGQPDEAKIDAGIKSVLAEKMSPAALKKLDGIIFANTTGELPLPDKEAFITWVKSGKAFVGMHSATDTFHEFRPYIEMIGGEFETHPAGLYDVECLNLDPHHPACAPLGKTWSMKDEIYMFKSYNADKVHQLLKLDKHPANKTPGDFPIAWCSEFGKGKVFYTELGHSETVWQNDVYQKHVLGGIKWALGLEKGDAAPQAK